MWTNENTVVVLGYLALIGGLWSVIFYLERRTRLLAQIVEVKERLTKQPGPHYKTVIQMDSDGSLVSFRSLMLMHVGEVVTVDHASGHITSHVPGSRAVGIVVSSEVVFDVGLPR